MTDSGNNEYRINSLVDLLTNVIPEYAFGYKDDISSPKIITYLTEAAKAIYSIDEFQKVRDIYKSGGQIEIIGTQNESYIILKIKDNGYGISEDKLEQIYKSFHDDSIHQGVGLKNVYQRIKIYYGEEADIKIDSLFDEGTIISIYIPKKKAVKNEEK